MQWNDNSYIDGKTSNFKYTNKLAMFDMDSTIIKTKLGGRFYKDLDDWVFVSDFVQTKLKRFSKKGYSIIIITNQGGMEKGKMSVDTWKTRIENIQRILGVELKIFCSKGRDIYRKPHPTFFDIILKECRSQNIDVDLNETFFCGDAAGRTGDFSDTDYKFSLNCGIKFYVPEGIFNFGEIGRKLSVNYTKEIYRKPLDRKLDVDKILENKNDKEMIIMVGMPGSGKSYLSKLISLEDNRYKIINRDTLKTMKKCLDKAEFEFKNGNCVIVDNTSPTPQDREKFIKIAKKYNYFVKCVNVNTSEQLSKHNNYYRNYITNGSSQIVPDIAYRIYKGKFKSPTMAEKIDNIIIVDGSSIEDARYLNYFY